jgi:hypothetical protein
MHNIDKKNYLVAFVLLATHHGFIPFTEKKKNVSESPIPS